MYQNFTIVKLPPLFLSLLALTLATGSKVHAQTDGRFNMSFKAGLTLSAISFGDEAIPANRIKPGFGLELNTTYQLDKSFFLKSGVGIINKGASIKGAAPLGFSGNMVISDDASLKVNQLYAQVPVELGYQFPVGTKKLFFTAGPYAAYGIAGKTQLNATIIYGDMIVPNDLVEENTYGSRGLQRWDYGARAGAGIDLGEVTIWLNYDLGLKNFRPKKETYFPFYNTSYNTRNLGVGLEFRF